MTQTSIGNLAQMTGLSPAELQRRAEGLVDAKTGKINLLSALDAALISTSTTAGKTAQEQFAALGAATANQHAIDDPTHTYTHGQPTGGYAPEAPAAPSIGGPVAQLEKAAKQGATRMGGFCGGATPPPEPPPPEVLVSSPEGDSNAGGCAPCQPEEPPPPEAAPPLSATPPPSTPATPTTPPATTPPSSSTPRAPIRAGSTTAAQQLQRRMHGFGGAAPGNATGGTNGAPTPGAPGGKGPTTADVTGVQGEVDASSKAIQFELIKNEIQKMTQLQNAISNTMAAMHEQAMTAIRNAKA